HQVVEMYAAVGDHAARPPGHLGAAHQPRAHPDEGEGADEPDQDQEESLLVVVGEPTPEVREDRGGDHAGRGAEFRRGPTSPRAAISSIVSSTAATAKSGLKAMLESDSASQLAHSEWPRAPWTRSAMAGASASPTTSIGTRTPNATQKWPRTRR